MSVVYVVRAIFLALILPSKDNDMWFFLECSCLPFLLVAIKILKPKPLILEIPVAPVETTPLLVSSSSSSSTTTSRKTIKREIHSPLFDLNLARVSLLADIVAYTSKGLAQSPILYAVSDVFGAFGAGFPPAAQSVALALYAKKGGVEIGRLFGALSLIQAVRCDTFKLCCLPCLILIAVLFSSQTLAPFIYGFVFVKTVAIFPSMVFFVSVATISTSYCLLSLIRLPKDDELEYHRQSFVDLEESGSNEELSASRPQERTWTLQVEESFPLSCINVIYCILCRSHVLYLVYIIQEMLLSLFIPKMSNNLSIHSHKFSQIAYQALDIGHLQKLTYLIE